MEWLLKRIGRLLKKGNNEIGHLYCLYGIKPINAPKSILDECTITKRK